MFGRNKRRNNILRRSQRNLVYSRTEPQKRSFLEKFPFTLFSFITIFILIYLVFFSPIFKVKDIKVEGAEGLEASKVEELARNNLGERLFKNNVLFFSSGSLESKIKKEFNSFKKVEVKKIYPRTVQVSLEKKGLGIIWQTQDKQYLLDDEGSVISEGISGENLIVVTDNSNLPIKVGDKVVSAGFVKFVTSLVDNLSKKTGVLASSIIIEQTTLEVLVKTSEGWTIYFDTTRDLDNQLNTLNNVLPEIQKTKKKIEYIDLRLENKVFYK